MKKKIILATVLGALISAPAFAAKSEIRTEGSRVGISAIKTDTARIIPGNLHGNNIGVGVDYKYAFNFDRVFVAPGIFYDYNHAKSTSSLSTTTSEQYKLKDSYGVKADVGYDICDKLAAYVTVGLSNTRVSSGANFNRNQNSSTKNRGGYLYGIGVKYAVNDQFDLNAAVERTKYTNGSASVNSYGQKRYDVIRVGTAVKF